VGRHPIPIDADRNTLAESIDGGDPTSREEVDECRRWRGDGQGTAAPRGKPGCLDAGAGKAGDAAAHRLDFGELWHGRHLAAGLSRCKDGGGW
jgi:hypothetical protein